MAVLAISLLQLLASLQPLALAGQCCLLFCQVPLLSLGGSPTVPVPSHCTGSPPPHPHVWGRPTHLQLPFSRRYEQLLAQGPKGVHQRLLLNSHIGPLLGALPPPHLPILQIQKTASSTSDCLRRPPPPTLPPQGSSTLSPPSLSSGPKTPQDNSQKISRPYTFP